MLSGFIAFHQTLSLESMAGLGVRRQSVDHVLGELESKQMIECLRGSIRLNDASALASVACECYHLAKERLDNCLT